VIEVAGPWYEDLEVGRVFEDAPGLTLNEGHAALHQAIVGDRLRLALDAHLAQQVIGPGPPLVHPGLVCDVAIGQSTLATQRVIANLFYRGLVFRSTPRIGDTLRTSTEIVALRDTSARPGRAAIGLAVLRVRTVDQDDRPVLDFHRCAMLPMRPGSGYPGHVDDLGQISDELSPESLSAAIEGWDLAVYRDRVDGPHADGLQVGARHALESGDTVSCAPELVRLTLNVAAAHSDPASTGSGRRLVYGGHTIGFALAHVTRALPNLVTIAAWRSCDHLNPVFEGDVLRSAFTVDQIARFGAHGGSLVDLHVETRADRVDGGGSDPVLDWRVVGVMA
jgi:acyl dehydratase